MRACACRGSSLFLSVSLGLVSLSVPGAANAGPGSGPLINFGQSILNFLTGPLAYVVFGVGICIAAISMVMGSREGIQKAVYAVIGGGLLFGVHAVIDFVQQASR
ncbi:MAG TPA: TrbC/VirB2 family protein [Candidatus Acidoferrales bacterium]|nr:TrbC/VirB2 family protein [Candidatus Acidoferrales bacterium]